ncbi:MAG: HDOD domain-containing protein [Halieaceae bacterium]|nr:HDOD domain-containing protein [Halieaceae bacterium]
MLQLFRKNRAAPAEAPPAKTPEPLTPERLQEFHAFSALAHDELMLLTVKLTPETIAKGECLFSEGDEDELDYLLLEGNIRLVANDGSTRELVGGTESASRVVSGLRPRLHTAKAISDCTYLALDPAVLGELMPDAPAEIKAEDTDFVDYVMHEFDVEGDVCNETAELLESFHADLKANRFTLTSIPDVALKIRKVMENPEVSAELVADVLSTDPAMSAKICKAANSAFYRGYDPCTSVVDAVVRLGVPTTRQLVLSYAIRDLFMCGTPGLAAALRKNWNQIVHVGAIATVLAKRSGRYTPEQGMLAGLLSNIGTLSVFNYLVNHPDICADEARMQRVVEDLKGDVGALVLERWGLPEEMITCARHSGDWSYAHDSETGADLCDLVITAWYHACIGNRRVPEIKSVAACQWMLGPALCPELAIDFMRDAKQEIDEARSLIEG